jgi:hypothetical protein
VLPIEELQHLVSTIDHLVRARDICPERQLPALPPILTDDTSTQRVKSKIEAQVLEYADPSVRLLQGACYFALVK